MRRLLVVYAVLATAGMAVGQVTVISGYAGNQGWGSYYPPTPYVPLVTTPIVSLDSSSGLTVGASNATAGNVAGRAIRQTSQRLAWARADSNVFTNMLWLRCGECAQTQFGLSSKITRAERRAPASLRRPRHQNPESLP